MMDRCGSNIRRRRLSGAFALAACAVTLSAGCFPDPRQVDAADAGSVRGKTFEAGQCLVTDDPQRAVDQTLQLINLERAAADLNLSPVVMNPKLSRIAEDYACRLIENDFFDHMDPFTGRGPAERAVAGGYRFFAIGENLGAGPESAAEVMRLWMESSAHRDIILDPQWIEVGIGVRDGGEFGTYWVQLFGDPAATR